MSTTQGCGPHCGIASGREGHCDCALCHDDCAPVVITREDLTAAMAGTPMCARWYERAGDFRPWHGGQHRPRYQAAPAEAGLSDPGTHHELCDVSICHPECAVRRGRELEHWREARKVIDQ